MGITRPNFNDLNPYKYYTTTSDYVSGNPDLRPSVAHNAEINYSFKGIYAVLYNSYNNDAIGYITRFNNDGSQYTIPENHINSNKTGLYLSYYRSFSDGGTSTLAASFSTHMPNQNLLITKMLTIAVGAGKLNSIHHSY